MVTAGGVVSHCGSINVTVKEAQVLVLMLQDVLLIAIDPAAKRLARKLIKSVGRINNAGNAHAQVGK